MENNLEAKIIEDLEKTGFPLEVFIASVLEDCNWMVYNSPLYRDEEMGQSRELDIHAVNVDVRYAKHITRKVKAKSGNKLVSHLVIQCKKSDKPWVFFDNGKTAWPQIPEKSFKSDHEEFYEMQFEELEPYGLKNNRLRGAVLHKSYHEVFSDPKHSSRIYESLITVVKALNFLKTNYDVHGYALHIFIPIIVLDGTLWSARLKKKERTAPNIVLSAADRLFVVFDQLSQVETENIALEEEYIIEVITRECFRKYLSEIETDNLEIYKCWTNYINAQE